MNLIRINAWNTDTKGICLTREAKAVLPPMPCAFTAYTLSSPAEAFTADIFTARRDFPAVALIPTAAPGWAELAVRAYFDDNGRRRADAVIAVESETVNA